MHPDIKLALDTAAVLCAVILTTICVHTAITTVTSPSHGRIECCYLQLPNTLDAVAGAGNVGRVDLMGLRHGMTDLNMGSYKTPQEALDVMDRLRCRSCAMPAPGAPAPGPRDGGP